MNFLIYFGITVAIIGIFVSGLALWSIISHREKIYNRIQHEHLIQTKRVKNNLDRKEDKKDED